MAAEPGVPSTLPVADILSGLAGHFADLSRRLDQLENATHIMVPRANAATPDVIKAMQNFDYLHQALGDLAVLARLLGGFRGGCALSLQDQRKVAAALHLASTKSLLVIGDVPTGSAPKDQQTGDPVIF